MSIIDIYRTSPITFHPIPTQSSPVQFRQGYRLPFTNIKRQRYLRLRIYLEPFDYIFDLLLLPPSGYPYSLEVITY